MKMYMKEKKNNFVKRAAKLKDTVKACVIVASLVLMGYPVPSYATGSYTTQITNLKTVLTTIITPIGAVLIVWGAVRFAIAFQKMDQNGEHSAIYTIVAGGICAGIGAVVAALG